MGIRVCKVVREFYRVSWRNLLETKRKNSQQQDNSRIYDIFIHIILYINAKNSILKSKSMEKIRNKPDTRNKVRSD